MKRINNLPTFTLKTRNCGNYELLNKESFELAINKLGRIEDFEKLVKTPVLDYISDLHAEHMELRNRELSTYAVVIAGVLHCPYCSQKINTFMNYCPDCGQKIKVEVIKND